MAGFTREQLVPYAVPVIAGIAAVTLFSASVNLGDDVEAKEREVAAYQQEVEKSKATLATLEEGVDKEELQTEVAADVISAKDMAKRLIDIDDTLTQFFKMTEVIEDKAEREAFFAKVDKAKLANTELTGATEADHIDTLKLNPEWETTLESTIVYANADVIPVVLSMKTKSGDNAGLVVAGYDVLNDQVMDVTKYYTNAGILDATAVGGR